MRPALAALFLAGAVHWLLFFGLSPAGLPGPRHDVGDWPKEFRYYTVLEQAVREHRMPYYVTRPINTRRFLAIPEVSWSPQILFLPLVPVGTFLALNTVFLYGIGFLGCLALRRRYGLSLLPFTFFFLLFTFNGHIVAHLGVGHSMWVGYFLLPFFVLLVLELLEDGPANRLVLKIALVLFLMLLQGAFHIFAWCFLFLGLLALFRPKYFRSVTWVSLWTLALGAGRLVPGVFLMLRRDQEFLSGFPSLGTLAASLVSIRDATYPRLGGILGDLNWWEYDTYVGWLGLAWILGFGLYPRLRRGAVPAQHPHDDLDGPLWIMALFSFSYVYWPVNLLPIPPLNTERVASRFLILPLVFWMLFAAIAMEAALKGLGPGSARRRKWLGATAAFGVAACLAVHSYVWRPAAVAAAFQPRKTELSIEILDPSEMPQNAREDAYVASVELAGAISVLALALVLWKLRARPTRAS